MADAAWADTASALASAVAEGVPTRALTDNLDLLLRWLADSAAPEAAELDAEFQRRRLEPGWARRLALMALDEALFSRCDRDPHPILGMESDATQEEARRRYHLLMRVYHPDLSGRDSRWLTDRAERINQAYARIAKERADASATPSPASPRAPGRRSLRVRRPSGSARRLHALRNRLGRPRALRRRVLAGLLVGCFALVVHTCVANRSWREWPSGSHASFALGGAAAPALGAEPGP